MTYTGTVYSTVLKIVKFHETQVTSGSQVLGPWVHCFYLPTQKRWTYIPANPTYLKYQRSQKYHFYIIGAF